MDDHDSEVDGLIDEHRQLMTILARLQRTAGEPGSDLDALLDQLDAELTHHTEREEAGLFHVLHQIDVSPEYMNLFEHDHRHLVELIATARGDRHSVDGLVKIFDAHMQREENDMFPAAEQLLGPDDWDAVDAAVSRLR